MKPINMHKREEVYLYRKGRIVGGFIDWMKAYKGRARAKRQAFKNEND